MAVNFKTENLILTKQQIRASGSNNMLYVNGVEVTAGVSGSIHETGLQSMAYANNIGINLSGDLTQTGIVLWNRDLSISGGLENRIAITGATAIWHANIIGQIISGNLTQTGITLYNRDTDISGALQNLITAANASVKSINGQSGVLQLTGAGNITVSSGGSNLIRISGNTGDYALFATKVQLTTTGQTLFNRDISISGGLEARIRATGNNVVNHSNGIGINLSGNLTQTGIILKNYTDNSVSGLISTGNADLRYYSSSNPQQYISSGGVNQISGILNQDIQNTGSILWDRDLSISGALQNLIVDASADVNSINGQSGILQITGDGNIIVSSGGPGLIKISGDTGSYNLFATKIDLTQTGSVLWNRDTSISGGLEARITLAQNNAQSFAAGIGINLSGNLLQTGTDLWNRDLLISGALQTLISNGDVSTLATANLYSDGVGVNLSGNLTQTGITLWNRDASISGGLQTRINLKADQTSLNTTNTNLYNTGSTLNNRINSLSGFAAPANANYVYTTGNQTITGLKQFNSGIFWNKVGINTDSPTYGLEINGSFAASSKSFIIPHPLHSGKRLQHGVIEGPSHSVYIVGSTGGKIIELPDYWTRLVDYSTVCVQLTPSGKNQRLYVKEIKENKVFINNGMFDFGAPKYYYNITAERIDIPKMKVEV